MSAISAIRAELTWTGHRFERDVRIELAGDGTIASTSLAVPGEPVWTRRAVIPGFVNAHSHAFQRGLRGHGETFPGERGSFWSWREAMYGLVERADAATVRALSVQAFREMLASGITTVGEFHYLHHDATEAGYAFDEVVLDAAAEAGIRISLLHAYYQEGGIGRALKVGQRRFRTSSPDEYWARLDALAAGLDAASQTLGAVAHSIRAVPPDVLAELHAESVRRGLVFHMHVEEQPAEIEACIEAYGGPPMAVLNDRLAIDDRFCAVHCTHTAPADMQRFLAAGGRVCICPLTEANLGDGVCDVPGVRAGGGTVGGPICLGTDSNNRLDFFEEMRWLEYVQRLSTQSRGVCVNEQGQCGAALLEVGTTGGAAALAVPAGSLAPGQVADLAAVDLDAPCLAGWTDDTLLDALVFGGGPEAIAATCVGGRWVYGTGP